MCFVCARLHFEHGSHGAPWQVVGAGKGVSRSEKAPRAKPPLVVVEDPRVASLFFWARALLALCVCVCV